MASRRGVPLPLPARCPAARCPAVAVAVAAARCPAVAVAAACPLPVGADRKVAAELASTGDLLLPAGGDWRPAAVGRAPGQQQVFTRGRTGTAGLHPRCRSPSTTARHHITEASRRDAPPRDATRRLDRGSTVDGPVGGGVYCSCRSNTCSSNTGRPSRACPRADPCPAVRADLDPLAPPPDRVHRPGWSVGKRVSRAGGPPTAAFPRRPRAASAARSSRGRRTVP